MDYGLEGVRARGCRAVNLGFRAWALHKGFGLYIVGGGFGLLRDPSEELRDQDQGLRVRAFQTYYFLEKLADPAQWVRAQRVWTQNKATKVVTT